MGKLDWLYYAVASAVVWGFWGFLDKIVIDRSGWPILVIGSALTYVILVPAVTLHFGKAMWPPPGITWVWALLGGAAASVGMLLFYVALAKGNASIVVPLTAMYPVITVLLSLTILKERPSVFQIIGIILAVVAVVFLSIDNQSR